MRIMTICIYPFFALFSLVFSGCGKGSKINADLLVRDSNTGLPVETKVFLYYYKKNDGSDAGSTELGTTDEEGRLRIRQKLANRTYKNMLTFEKGYNAIAVSADGARHKIIVELKPSYRYTYRLNSIHCFDETDTLWFTSNADFIMNPLSTGCIDKTYVSLHPGLGPLRTPNPTLHLNLKIKRNGVVTYSERNFTLDQHSVTPVTVEY